MKSPIGRASARARQHQHGTVTSIEHREPEDGAPAMARVTVRHGPKLDNSTGGAQPYKPWPRESTLHMAPHEANNLSVGQRVKVGCSPAMDED